MRIILDIETNGLISPDKIWVACGIDIDTGKEYTFREPWRDYSGLRRFLKKVKVFVGHNFLGFDILHLNRLVAGLDINHRDVIDTLVISRLVDYRRAGGHSLDAWGETLGVKKPTHTDWDNFSEEMVTRCLQDTRINFKLYNRFLKYIQSPLWRKSLRLEHEVSYVCNELHTNGFHFNLPKAKSLYTSLKTKLDTLDVSLRDSFLPIPKGIKVVTPRSTLHGTLNRNDFRWVEDGDLTPFTPGAPFTLLEWEVFNPSSPKQIVSRLNEAGWKPYQRTKGYLEALRVDDTQKVRSYDETGQGWKVSEENLATLPQTAPEPARKLAERLLLASRVRRLDEWFNAYTASTMRIHGSFSGIGGWTHRMSHSAPNMANIPTEKPQDTKEVLEINRVMREAWCVPEGHLLIGVDADQIQLRVLAHYMQDKEFIDALVSGDKSKGTDVHSLNVRAIGPACKGRRDAKTFIYAWLLGAGVDRVAEILDCLRKEAKDARERFLTYYPGLQRLKKEDIPRDARNGYIKGLDNRFIVCHDEHRVLAGYLQSGEAIIMKTALMRWREDFRRERIPYKLVNFVHDEWQTELLSDDMQLAQYAAEIQAESIRWAGEELGMRCPTKGSIYGGHDQLAIGRNWFETH